MFCMLFVRTRSVSYGWLLDLVYACLVLQVGPSVISKIPRAASGSHKYFQETTVCSQDVGLNLNANLARVHVHVLKLSKLRWRGFVLIRKIFKVNIPVSRGGWDKSEQLGKG